MGIPKRDAVSISLSETPGFGKMPNILVFFPPINQCTIVITLMWFRFLSTNAMFPTKFALLATNNFFTFSCAIIHILRLAETVTTGVFVNNIFASSDFKNEFIGMEGVKYQVVNPNSIKSYFF